MGSDCCRQSAGRARLKSCWRRRPARDIFAGPDRERPESASPGRRCRRDPTREQSACAWFNPKRWRTFFAKRRTSSMTATTESTRPFAARSWRLTGLEPTRAAIEYGGMRLTNKSSLPVGDGHAVVMFPGLASDSACGRPVEGLLRRPWLCRARLGARVRRRPAERPRPLARRACRARRPDRLDQPLCHRSRRLESRRHLHAGSGETSGRPCQAGRHDRHAVRGLQPSDARRARLSGAQRPPAGTGCGDEQGAAHGTRCADDFDLQRQRRRSRLAGLHPAR